MLRGLKALRPSLVRNSYQLPQCMKLSTTVKLSAAAATQPILEPSILYTGVSINHQSDFEIFLICFQVSVLDTKIVFLKISIFFCLKLKLLNNVAHELLFCVSLIECNRPKYKLLFSLNEYNLFYSQLFINNEWYKSKSGEIFPSVNPATGKEIAQIQAAGKEDVDRAVAAAREAFK